jgi:hypothetical protein
VENVINGSPNELLFSVSLEEQKPHLDIGAIACLRSDTCM